MFETSWLLNASTKPIPDLICGDFNVVIFLSLAPSALTISPFDLYCVELFLSFCPIVYPPSKPTDLSFPDVI